MITDQAVAYALEMITADIQDGDVPWDVPDFSALHDFTDANMYLIDTAWVFAPDLEGEQFNEYLDELANALNYKLTGYKDYIYTRGPRWEVDTDGYYEWLIERKRSRIA